MIAELHINNIQNVAYLLLSLLLLSASSEVSASRDLVPLTLRPEAQPLEPATSPVIGSFHAIAMSSVVWLSHFSFISDACEAVYIGS